MKSKKTMLILPVVVVALCAVALIGAGFATNYTGTTTNTGNNVNSAYITLNSDEYAASFTKEILYDTENVGGQITYRPQDTETINVPGEQDPIMAVDLGTVVITVARTDMDLFDFNISNAGSNTGDYYISCKVNNEQNPTFYKYQNSNLTIEDLGSKTNKDNTTLEIHLYLKVANVTSAPTNPMTGVIFTFEATADDGVAQN